MDLLGNGIDLLGEGDQSWGKGSIFLEKEVNLFGEGSQSSWGRKSTRNLATFVIILPTCLKSTHTVWAFVTL